MLDTNMKLKFFNQRYNILIIAINYYYLKTLNVQIELIEEFAQLNRFFNNLNLINIFDFIN